MKHVNKLLAVVVLALAGWAGLAAQDAGAETEAQSPDAAQAASAAGSENVDPVTVTASRDEKRLADSPVVTEVITREEIEESSASTVVDVLKQYGLVSVADAHGDNIQFQGLGGNQVLILVDGKRVIGRVSGFIDGDSLPLDNVERIEIVRGPQSVLYGSDGMAGVINIVTKKAGDKIGFRAAISDRMLGSYDDPATTNKKPAFFESFNPVREQVASIELDLPVGIFRNSLAVQGARGDYYYNELENASVLPQYGRISGSLKTDIRASDSLSLGFGGNAAFLESSDLISASGSSNRTRTSRAGGFAEASWLVSDGASLKLKLYDNYFERQLDSYAGLFKKWTEGQNFQYGNLFSAELYGLFDLSESNLLTAGIEASYEDLKKYDLLLPDNRASMDKQALVLQDEFYQENLYSVVLGARLERSSQYGLSFVPKLSAMYYLAPGFRILGGAGVGYREPDFTSLYIYYDTVGHPVIEGNPDLRPEYNVGGNLGVEFSAEQANARLNLYYQEVFDQIVYVPQNYAAPDGREVYRSENVDRTFSTGLNAEGSLSFLEYGRASIAYELVLGYDRNTQELLRKQPIHALRAKLGLDAGQTGPSASFSARLYSPLDEDDPLAANRETRFILDFYAAYAFSKEFKLALTIDNLTGLVNNALGPFVGPQLSISAQLSL